jgi:phosphoribosyl 1,2-cyclic phosphate phosphodiesterase
VKITVLGSGTSTGVPTIGCHCDVCTSTDPRDNRLRPSVLFQIGGKNLLIDTTPDFRAQMLRAKVQRLDAVFFTHPHADHVLGLDDVRPFNFRQSGSIPMYGSAETLSAIRRIFPYIFSDRTMESSVPKIDLNEIDDTPFALFGVKVTPVKLKHGKHFEVLGFRINDSAYLTDHSEIPDEALEQLHGLDVLFLDALRYKPHPTHSTVERSLQYVEQLAPRMAYFTHICHDLAHERAESMLPANVRLAYDGLEIDVGGAE